MQAARKVNRRTFLSASAVSPLAAADASAPVRIGVIGAGNRGRSLTQVLARRADAVIPAMCDIDQPNLERAVAVLAKQGRPAPELYSRGEEDYKRLLAREDLDAVIIATPWEWHARMAIDSMRAGKYAAVEVPAAQTLAECWALVETYERTKVPCMMLENWSFRRDNLAVLQMIRQGLFGEIVHCHCAHSHDCIDHWFFDPQGNDRWPARYLVERNCDQYPTHSLGPVLSWMDINCGDAFASISSTATEQWGIHAYFRRKFGPDHPNARRKFAQGDIVTSIIRTHRGKTVVVNYDMQLPRPYDNRWMIQGTLGLYDEDKASVYIAGRSPKYHQWEPFAPYQEQYDHPWWRDLARNFSRAGHGGTDDLELALFLQAVRSKSPTPIDVYDSVTMSAVVALSGESIAKGGAVLPYPDFTRGAWKRPGARPQFAAVH